MVIKYYAKSTRHDNLLFVAILLTGFFALLRLGELTLPNDKLIRDWKKIVRRDTVSIRHDSYAFHLPTIKPTVISRVTTSLFDASNFNMTPFSISKRISLPATAFFPSPLPYGSLKLGKYLRGHSSLLA